MGVIADLIRAGVDPDLVARVADELAQARAEGAASVNAAPARTARQERNRRYYESHKHQRLEASEIQTIETIKTVSDAADPSPKEGPPHPLRNNPSPSLPSVGSRSARAADEFEVRFWPAYPHRVGKAEARKAFDRVMRGGLASIDDLLAGIDRYRRTKPTDRPWCNPATWLNQGRWADEPAEVEPRPALRVVEPRAPPPDRQSSVARRMQNANDLLERLNAEFGA